MKLLLRLLFCLLPSAGLVAATPSAFALRASARPEAAAPRPAGSVSLENAWRAQALLGAEVWSRVIRVENTGRRRAYPETVYALVFEEGGVLWFYTDTDGTQSLSANPGRLAEEKSDFVPLLRGIEPGFAAYEVLPLDVARVSRPVFGTHGSDPCHFLDSALPNGCIIECLGALREQVRRGEPIERARLLSCYFDTPAGRRGHTVLTYETRRGLFLLDPGRSPAPRSVPRVWADDPMALARAALQGADVARARWVPTALPARPALVAAGEFDRDLVPAAAPRLMR